MANFAKYARGSVTSMTQHYERKKGKDGEYLRFKNQEIDSERTHLNYNLAPERDQCKFITERTESLKALKRKDVNVLGSWVVTVPQECPEEHQREFFEQCYSFLENKYGKANVVSAWVHMDENTPHMHFAFVPVVYDKKKDREKVSCKECVTKHDLERFHGELQAHLDKWRENNEYEFDCDILNGATANGNRTVEEMRAEKLEAHNDIVANALEEATFKLSDISNEINRAYMERESLNKSLSDLHTDISAMTEKRAEIERTVSEKNSEVTDLQNQITERKDELEVLEKAIKEKKAEAVSSGLFADSNMQERIERAKQEQAREHRLSLLERFVELPKIKPIWEKFCAVMEHQRGRESHKDKGGRF